VCLCVMTGSHGWCVSSTSRDVFDQRHGVYAFRKESVWERGKDRKREREEECVCVIVCMINVTVDASGVCVLEGERVYV